MPLQTGATAFKTSAFSFILILFLWGVWPILVIFLMARDARRRRASDIVFDDDGFRIEGGRHDGYEHEWQTIDPRGVNVAETDELFVKSGDKPAQNIHTLTVDGDVIAESGDPEEIASLHVVARIIAEASGKETVVPAPKGDAIACVSCGAPLVPRDGDVMTCAYCNHGTPVPPALREAIRSAAEQDRSRDRVARAVERLLSSGRALSTNRAVLAFFLAGHLVVPAALLALSATGNGALAASMLLYPVALAAVVRILLARRHALRALTMGCAALTSFDPTQPPRCRRCLAPLPPIERSVATCPYCRASNVLGLSLGMSHGSPGAEEEIEQVVDRQRASVLMASLILVTTFIVLVVLLARAR
jgi:hypothetical protein